MSEQSLEKSDHELDIRRADCRSKFWQQAQAEEQRENLKRMAERNSQVAQPLADVLNKFSAEKGEQ